MSLFLIGYESLKAPAPILKDEGQIVAGQHTSARIRAGNYAAIILANR